MCSVSGGLHAARTSGPLAGRAERAHTRLSAKTAGSALCREFTAHLVVSGRALGAEGHAVRPDHSVKS